MKIQFREPRHFENAWTNVRYPTLAVIASWASILGVAVGLLGFWKWSWEFIPAAFLSLLAVFALVRYQRNLRWASYSEALVGLNVATEQVQRAFEIAEQQWLDGHTERGNELFLDTLRDSLSTLAQAFSLVSRQPCRVALAELAADGDDDAAEKKLWVQVLVRSSLSGRQLEEERQPLEANSDFLDVFVTGEPFFCNDLIAAYLAGEYLNSKWDQRQVARRRVTYRSAIVWPVQSGRVRAGGSPALHQPLAFLCLDAPRVNAFAEATDLPMGWVFARALYPLVSHWLART